MKLSMKNLLVISIVFLAALLVLNISLNAIEPEVDELDAILDLVPDSYELDFPENEYEKVPEIILKDIQTILSDNEIESEYCLESSSINDYTCLRISNYPEDGVYIEIYASNYISYEIEEFYTAYVRIEEFTKNNEGYNNYLMSKRKTNRTYIYNT